LRGRAKPTNQPGKLLTRDEARRIADRRDARSMRSIIGWLEMMFGRYLDI
jgi:hypothetical protein